MDDKEIKKRLSGLDKVKAPHNFLERVNARIEGKNKVFFPVPMRVATAVATMVLLLSVYSVYKYVGPADEEMMTEKKSGVAAPVVIENDNIMLIGAGASAGAPMMTRSASPAGPVIYTNFYQLKRLIKQHDGRVIKINYDKATGQVQVVTVDIPVDNYTFFLIKLGSLGELKPPLPTKSDNGFVRFHIKL